MLHTVRSMLPDNDFVHVFSFDFSKAFDTVRHSTLTSKLAQLELPDSIYNWAVDFLENHAHCTKYAGLSISSRRHSGHHYSRFGDRARLLCRHRGRFREFKDPVHRQNRICKFADDTYLVVLAVNTDTCQEEIDHIQTWAADNIKLNPNKTKEIVFSSRR